LTTDENDRRAVFTRGSPLQVEAVHVRQQHIQNQAEPMRVQQAGPKLTSEAATDRRKSRSAPPAALEGYDRDRQDAGSRREAFYTIPGPGSYRFRVIACNSDGIWNGTGATLSFAIAPLTIRLYDSQSFA
jgi:hypothetical protein